MRFTKVRLGKCPCTINANDPRPEKGDTTANIDCSLSKYAQKNRHRLLIKRIYVSVHPVLVQVEISRFHFENKS